MSTEPIGSLAEEAAKLIAVVQGWAGDHTAPADPAAAGDDGPAPRADEDHQGHDAQCQWCPLCQSVRLAKAATPEVRDHLASAALSLAMAFKELLDNVDGATTRPAPVEKIDIDLDSPED